MFKQFKNYNYEVNERGVVRNRITKKVLKPYLNDKGYFVVCLYRGLKRKNIPIHRIELLTFTPNPENKRCVNHKNGIKTDNRLVNLEWATHSENTKHAYDMGIIKDGELHKNSKISNEQVKYIRDNPENLTGSQLAKLTGCSDAWVSLIKNNKQRLNG